MTDLNSTLKNLRSFYDSGATLSYEFRKKQLEAFEKAIIKYDGQINGALYADLKKSKEETWATETGLLMGEIKNAHKSLHKWMKAKKVPTGLVTFPSSGKIYRDPLGTDIHGKSSYVNFRNKKLPRSVSFYLRARGI